MRLLIESLAVEVVDLHMLHGDLRGYVEPCGGRVGAEDDAGVVLRSQQDARGVVVVDGVEDAHPHRDGVAPSGAVGAVHLADGTHPALVADVGVEVEESRQRVGDIEHRQRVGVAALHAIDIFIVGMVVVGAPFHNSGGGRLARHADVLHLGTMERFGDDDGEKELAGSISSV